MASDNSSKVLSVLSRYFASSNLNKVYSSHLIDSSNLSIYLPRAEVLHHCSVQTVHSAGWPECLNKSAVSVCHRFAFHPPSGLQRSRVTFPRRLFGSPEFVYDLIDKSLAVGLTRPNQRKKSEEIRHFPLAIYMEAVNTGYCG